MTTLHWFARASPSYRRHAFMYKHLLVKLVICCAQNLNFQNGFWQKQAALGTMSFAFSDGCMRKFFTHIHMFAFIFLINLSRPLRETWVAWSRLFHWTGANFWYNSMYYGWSTYRLLRAYENPLVSLHKGRSKPVLNPYFWGGLVRGVWLTCHECTS